MRPLVLTFAVGGALWASAACRHEAVRFADELVLPDAWTDQRSQVGPVPPGLVDTSWRLVRLDGRDLDPDLPEITFRLGTYRGEGSAGCNWYTAWLETPSPSQLTVSHLAVTRRDCLHPRLMDRETRYLEALETIEAYRIAGEELVMTVEGGTTLDFRRD